MRQTHYFIFGCVLAAAFSLPADVKAEPVVSTDITYYDVSGSSMDEVESNLYQQAALHIKKEKIFTAYTHYKIRWKFRFRKENNICNMTQVNTTVNVAITAPRLREDDSIPVDVRQAFSEYADNLMLHENGHANIGITLAKRIDEGIRNISGEAECNDLKNNANALGNAILAEGRQQNKDYDAETRHGATQGARFNR